MKWTLHCLQWKERRELICDTPPFPFHDHYEGVVLNSAFFPLIYPCPYKRGSKWYANGYVSRCFGGTTDTPRLSTHLFVTLTTKRLSKTREAQEPDTARLGETGFDW